MAVGLYAFRIENWGDGLQMREEGDLLVAEAQAFFADGATVSPYGSA